MRSDTLHTSTDGAGRRRTRWASRLRFAGGTPEVADDGGPVRRRPRHLARAAEMASNAVRQRRSLATDTACRFGMVHEMGESSVMALQKTVAAALRTDVGYRPSSCILEAKRPRVRSSLGGLL